MLSKKSEVTFYAILIAALLLAPAQAFVLAESIRVAESTARQHPLEIIDTLANWTKVRDSNDIETPDVVLRTYRQGNSNLTVVARQASIYNFIHDLYFCMTSNESAVKTIGKRTYKFDGHILNATLFEDTCDKTPMRTLMWFQNREVSAADRFDWRLALIKNPCVMQLPLCRNVRISVNQTANQTEDDRKLVAAAKTIFQSKF